MQGIILAAGMGKRLKELTENNTKCMVKVNGITLIERMLRQLDALNLSKIIVVTGYEGQKLKDHIETLHVSTKIIFVDNPIYDKTNNIYSLSLAKEYMLSDDTLLLESDLVFENEVLECLLNDERDTLALVDKYESWMDGTCMKIGEDDTIEEFVPGSRFQFDEAGNYYKTVNIYKFSKDFSKTHYVPFMDAYIKALGSNEYYEQVLKVIAILDDHGIEAKRLSGQLWYEIDDIQDLDIASSLFATDDEHLRLLQNRYGGYWRYPKLLDFCYLVNPYYPPKKLMDEMKSSFETLITQYPSGMEVNSLLAAKYFSVKQKHIVIGNGASELIKSIMNITTGTVGIIRPSFEEYSHRYDSKAVKEFCPNNSDFSYTVDDLIEFYSNNPVDNIILINPDNPSGNYISKNDVIRFAKWCDDRKIQLILDESFVDFADEVNPTLIAEDIICEFESLVIVKSISKTYGIPGLRLGIIVSGNNNVISLVKKDVSIWNINSFAEFYMQIAEKYKKNYLLALDRFRVVRKKMFDELSKIDTIRVIPSQANYFMVEIKGMTATEFTGKLLKEYNLFIKDLTNKFFEDNDNYVRIAIRTEEENNMLVNAIKYIFRSQL